MDTSLDDDYMHAAQSGDMETAQQLVAEAAEREGYPSTVLYHTATAKEPFTEFKYGALLGGEARYRRDGRKGALQFALEGLSVGWFTDSSSQFSSWKKEDQSNVIKAFVRVSKPLVLKADPDAQAQRLQRKARYVEIKEMLKEDGQFLRQSKRDALRRELSYLEAFVRPDTVDENRVLTLNEEIKTAKGLKRREAEKELRGLEKKVGNEEGIYNRRAVRALADPFYALENMANFAAKDFPHLVPGAALRAAMLREGYDGVILKGTNCDTVLADRSLNTWVVPFLGGSQIKSAEPITRDRDGNIIALSQRFDSSPCFLGNPKPDKQATIDSLSGRSVTLASRAKPPQQMDLSF